MGGWDHCCSCSGQCLCPHSHVSSSSKPEFLWLTCRQAFMQEGQWVLPPSMIASVLKKFPAGLYCWKSSNMSFFWKRQVVLGWGRKSIGWQEDLVVHPNLSFHLSCSKRGTSINCCSDASPTSWWVWSDALFAVLQLVQLLKMGAWTVKPLKDTFASKHVHSKYLIRLFFIYLWSIQCSAVGREQLHLERLMLNPRSSSSCSLLCIPGVRCCCHIPVVCSGRDCPSGTEGAWLSHRMWREISAVAASCHPQFHMSVFSLTFSNNTKSIWLTSETTHLFLAAKTRPRVTYCKVLFPPDSDLYWSLLKSCVQFFHNCPHSDYGRQPVKH